MLDIKITSIVLRTYVHCNDIHILSEIIHIMISIKMNAILLYLTH